MSSHEIAEVDVANQPRPISEMTDSEKLDEILMTMRTVGKALEAFTNSGPGQMMARMMLSRK